MVLVEPDLKKISNQRIVYAFFMGQETKINIGFVIRKKMSEQGTTIAWLARQINCDRSNLCKQLQNAHIYPELLLKISIALKTDFFAYYSHYFKQIAECWGENRLK